MFALHLILCLTANIINNGLTFSETIFRHFLHKFRMSYQAHIFSIVLASGLCYGQSIT